MTDYFYIDSNILHLTPKRNLLSKKKRSNKLFFFARRSKRRLLAIIINMSYRIYVRQQDVAAIAPEALSASV
jgi:hypothetical protein